MLSQLAYHLRKNFPKEAGNIFWSLMYFPQVRECISTPDFFEHAEKICTEASDWRVGNLVQYNCQSDHGPQETSMGRAEFTPEAFTADEVSFQIPFEAVLPPVSFCEAGRLANDLKALLDRSDLDTVFDYMQNYAPADTAWYESWKLPIVCLSGFLHETDAIAIKLLELEKSDSALILAVLIYCCNHFQEKALYRRINRLLLDSTPTKRIAVLKFLFYEGKKELSAALARGLIAHLKEMPGYTSGETTSPLLLDGNDSLYEMSLYQFAGQTDDLDRAIISLRHRTEVLSLGLGVKSLQSGGNLGSLKNIQEMIEKRHFQGQYADQLLFELSAAAFRLGTPLFIPDTRETPFDLFTAFKKAILHEPREICSELGQRAIKCLITSFEIGAFSKTPDFVEDYGFTMMVETFIEAGYWDEAFALGNLLIQHYPTDVRLMHLLSKVYAARSDNENALHYTLLESAYVGNQPEIYRRLYQLFGALEQPEEAYAQLQQLRELEGGLMGDEKLQLARLALQTGEYQTACELAQELIQEDDSQEAAYRILGEASYHLGDYPGAVTSLKEAVDRNPFDAYSFYLLAESMRNDPEEGDVIRMLLQSSEILPESATIQMEIAREYFLRDMISDGLPYLHKASSFPPDTRAAAMGIGNLLTSLGDIRGAFDYYQKALDALGFDVDIARLALTQALALEEYPSAEILASTLYEHASTTAGDIAALLIAKLGGQSPILTRDTRMTAEEIDEYLRLIGQALELDEQHIEANLMKAEILAYTGDYLTARRIIAGLIEKGAEDNWKMSGDLGVISLRLNDYHTAVAALQDSYQSNPDNGDLEYFLAEASMQAGLVNDTRYFADKVLNRAPGDARMLVWYSDIMEKVGDKQGALTALMNAIEIQPDDSSIRIRLVTTLFHAGRLQEAQQRLEGLSEELSLDPGVIRQLGQIYVHFQEWEKLSSLLEAHIESHDSERGLYYFLISRIQQKLGEQDAAFAYSQKALEVDAKNAYFYIHQADLLYLYDKNQAALSLVEHAEQIISDEYAARPDMENELVVSLFPESWCELIINGVGLTARKALILKKVGNVEDAFCVVRKALENQPDQNILRCFAAELGLQRGEFDYVLNILQDMREEENVRIRSALRDLRIRTYLLLNKTEELGLIVKDMEGGRGKTSEALSASARLEAMAGNWVAANGYYQSALTAPTPGTENCEQHAWGASGYDLLADGMTSLPYWIYDAGYHLYLWDESAENYHKSYLENPDNVAIRYSFAKLLIDSVEWDIYSDWLSIQTHRSHFRLNDTDSCDFVKKLLDELELYQHNAAVEKLMERARLLFTSEPFKFKDISNNLSLPEDIGLIVALLRREEKYHQLAAVADRLGRHFQWGWQQALCQFDGNLQKAGEIMKTAVETGPNSPLVQFVNGMYYEASKDDLKAYQAYREAVKIWSDEPQWLRHTARMALNRNEMEVAIAYLENAIEYDWDNLQAIIDLGNLYFQTGKPDKTVSLVNTAYQSGNRGLPILLLLGEAYFRTNDFEKAFEFAEIAKATAPDSTEPYLLFARICAKLEKFDASLNYGRMALEIQPENETILIYLSDLLEQAGNQEEAYQLLEKMIVAGNTNPVIMLEYIKKKRKLYGPQSVLMLLEQIKDADPYQEMVHEFLAEAYFESGQMNHAEWEAQAAIKVQEVNPRMKFILARINHLNGQLDLAIHYSIEAITEDPLMVEAYLELAEIHKGRREITHALNVYKQAIKTAPKSFLPYYHAGLLLRETRDYEEAEVMLKQAAKLAPEDLNIRRQLGAVVALNLVHHVQEDRVNL